MADHDTRPVGPDTTTTAGVEGARFADDPQAIALARREDLRSEAISLGFDALRFTSPARPDHGSHVRAWLDAGMHGDMDWLERRNSLRSGRLDDPRLLENARTVLVGAVAYQHPDPIVASGRRGVVAKYARGDDYHRVLWDRLDSLADLVANRYPGSVSRGFTDSGPIRERELARRAGIGWQGRHTNLISLDLGNFTFLCALLTTAEIPIDEPFGQSHCGTCVRCMEACPTAAIVAPLVLDARRCISYLTIEHHGSIPLELRPAMGNRIFGCDDCLDACPWNEHATRSREVRFAARDPERAFPDLVELLRSLASEAWFRERFRGTPILRTGRARLRRNVCIALGNVGDGEAVGPLRQALDSDPDPDVREHALWALEQIEDRVGRTVASNATS